MNKYLHVVVLSKNSITIAEYKKCLSVEIKLRNNINWFLVKHNDLNTIITNEYQVDLHDVYILGVE